MTEMTNHVFLLPAISCQLLSAIIDCVNCAVAQTVTVLVVHGPLGRFTAPPPRHLYFGKTEKKNGELFRVLLDIFIRQIHRLISSSHPLFFKSSCQTQLCTNFIHIDTIKCHGDKCIDI